MAKQNQLHGIVLPTRKMNRDQLNEQAHFARRAARWTDRHAQNRKGITKGGRQGSLRAAITAG
jgi:hypothetical protein